MRRRKTALRPLTSRMVQQHPQRDLPPWLRHNLLATIRIPLQDLQIVKLRAMFVERFPVFQSDQALFDELQCGDLASARCVKQAVQ